MSRLSKLAALCNCELSLIVNSHKSARQTVKEFLDIYFNLFPEEKGKLDQSTIDMMIAKNMTVELQIFNGVNDSYSFIGYDIDSLIMQATTKIKADKIGTA